MEGPVVVAGEFLYCSREDLCTVEIQASFICAYCFSVNDIVVDSTGGLQQWYTEDCEVCCRPNRLTVSIDEDLENAAVSAEQE